MKLTFATLYHIIFPISFITTIISVLTAIFLTLVKNQTTLASQIIFYEILFLSSMLGLHIGLDILHIGLDIYLSKANIKEENEKVVK